MATIIELRRAQLRAILQASRSASLLRFRVGHGATLQFDERERLVDSARQIADDIMQSVGPEPEPEE